VFLRPGQIESEELQQNCFAAALFSYLKISRAENPTFRLKIDFGGFIKKTSTQIKERYELGDLDGIQIAVHSFCRR
jgi:hypothetical protein